MRPPSRCLGDNRGAMPPPYDVSLSLPPRVLELFSTVREPARIARPAAGYRMRVYENTFACCSYWARQILKEMSIVSRGVTNYSRRYLSGIFLQFFK